MSDPLYGRPLLRLAANATGAGRLNKFDAQGAAYNPACGDRVTVTMRIGPDRRIAAIAFEAQACVLTQASGSIIGAHAPGLDETELLALRNQVVAMLQGDAEVSPPFSDFTILKPAAIHRNRHSCVLLPIDAALNALSSRLEGG